MSRTSYRGKKLELVMNALSKLINLINNHKPVERSPYELERNKEILAEERKRDVDSASKGSQESQEASTNQS